MIKTQKAECLCSKDLSSGKGNATKYTVLRDRIVISKGENNYDIIDINSSIFGYDMAKLQLPDTNIVFRDTNHISGEMFGDIKITGVNVSIATFLSLNTRVSANVWVDTPKSTS